MIVRIEQITTQDFKKPLAFSNGSPVHQKHTLTISMGEYQSEVSYIKGFARHSLEEVKRQIENFDNISPIDLYNEIQFAISHINLQKENINFTTNIDHLQKNILITNLESIAQLEECGPSVYKLKIGRINCDREIELINSFLKQNPLVSIRLDGNQTLSKNTIEKYWVNIIDAKKRIDYFEEPFNKLSTYKDLPDIPYAHDELVHDYFSKKESSWPKALVIKPSLFGDINQLINLSTVNTNIVISHCFESNLLQPLISWIATHWPNNIHGIK